MRPSEGMTAEMLEIIAARVRPACPDIPDDEFRDLVLEIARVKLKYDGDKFAAVARRTATGGAHARID